jgi:hypothetical protein
VEDLKKDLQKALEIEEKKIAISPVNRHIVIKVSEPRKVRCISYGADILPAGTH